MAKNVLQKKQRIAHNKTLFNDDHEMFPDGCDVLSNIMEGMKNMNYILPSMHSNNKFETDFMEYNKKSQSSSIQIPVQNHVNKSKKFGTSRECPLMKKCQRDLKQIKHNRKMPKPRAHLAGLAKSPIRNSPSKEIRSVSNLKLKKNKVTANNVKNPGNRFAKEPFQLPIDKTTAKQSKPVLKRNTMPEEQSSLKGASKEQQTSSTKKNSQLENYKTSDNSSDSDDYEKFIRKEKKSLPKKPKNQKNSKKPNSSTKKVAKKRVISKPLSSESDSETSDEEFISKSYKKSKRRKKVTENRLSASNEESESGKRRKKVTENRLSASNEESESGKRRKNVIENRLSASNEESESEMDIINDEPCHDSFSESDDLPPLSEILPEMSSSASLKGYNQSGVHIMNSIQNDSFKDMSNVKPIVSHKSSDVASKMMSSIPMSSNTHGIFSNAKPIVSHKSSDIVTKMGSIPVSSNTNGTSSISVVSNDACSTENNVTNVNIKQENSNEPVIDLTESDNECDNSFSIMPKIVMTCSQSQNKSPTSCVKADSDSDSEIEMVHVIVSKEWEKTKKNIQENSSNAAGLHIKTEVNQTLPSNNVETQKQSENLQTSYTRMPIKNEPVFSTDICKQIDEKQSELSDLKSDKLQVNPATKKESALPLNKKLKIEPEDDCEIIFDVSGSNTNQNLNTTCDKTIKIEKDLEVLKEIKQTTAHMNKIIPKEKELLIGKDVSGSNTSQNLNTTYGNKTIKIEKDFKVLKEIKQTAADMNKIIPKEKELLIGKDVDSPGLNNVIDTCNKNPELLGEETYDYVYLSRLYEELNNEFSTYTDIVHTEQSVEATFRMLEMRQAEKCRFLKAQIDKILLGPLPSLSSEERDALREKHLNSSQLSNQKAQTPVSSIANITNSDVSIKDLKTFASMNIVPLSSISEMDIKPNLSELQSSIKKEPSTSAETNNMSFGEKCIVCMKDAAAACQQCAKVFFCSHECGIKYWNDGHKDACTKSQ